MARKIFLIFLLIAGWVVIFYPLVAKPGTLGWSFGVHPARNLPQPWKSGAAVQIAPQTDAAAGTENAETAAPCPEKYTVQAGESLGAIARRCSIGLASLLAANPQISNANQVYAGQALSIPVLAGRGGGDDLAGEVHLAGGYTPGAVIDLQASGLPPRMPVRVGIGLTSSGYQVIETATSGLDGSLALSITIPMSAKQGEQGFILITAAGIPSVQVISPEFTIE